MTKLLIIGAGRSATTLINYLLEQSITYKWQITVADVDLNLAKQKIANHQNATAIEFNIDDKDLRQSVIQKHDFIISMLPAFMHMPVAIDCLTFGKNLATASYVSKEMAELNSEIKKKGLMFLNECGLDPGIDHASAMKIIDEIESNGGAITSFKSYCGGLVAPESNNNPWGYKFSWNPRNVVLAGQSTAQYLLNGEIKFLPYNRLFKNIDVINVDGYGNFDAYANRDSLSYIDVYGLKNVKTMLRGTLRQLNYCKAWQVFVKLGLTDDGSKLIDTNLKTYSDLINAFLPSGNGSLKQRLIEFVGNEWDNDIELMMEYLELFSNKPLHLSNASAAQHLQALLEEKWKLNTTDKDMIVMQHLFEYKNKKGELKKVTSSLVVVGDDNINTAMAKTVGLPLAICVKNYLIGIFKEEGVVVPIKKSIYEPLLIELEEKGIVFKEEYN
ncbi:MAG: saccharopine dehydrogenase NADP-binding domain-containing protein [Bacteroidetes bacterium]|nr:saccharopine dehydrogenase NADP-binding domain-containing protein [Bacteroidota bacterium]